MKYLGFQGLHPTVTNKPTIAIFEDNSSECIRQKNTNNTYCRLRHFWSSIMVIETGTSNVCVSDQHPTSNSGWWFQPLWKILVSWDDYSQYTVWKNKNVPNHQPDSVHANGLQRVATIVQPLFSLHMYRTGAATVMHPAFADRGLVEQVLCELGVGPNSEPAAIPTEDFGDVAVRGAREALSLEDDDDVWNRVWHRLGFFLSGLAVCAVGFWDAVIGFCSFRTGFLFFG